MKTNDTNGVYISPRDGENGYEVALVYQDDAGKQQIEYFENYATFHGAMTFALTLSEAEDCCPLHIHDTLRTLGIASAMLSGLGPWVERRGSRTWAEFWSNALPSEW